MKAGKLSESVLKRSVLKTIKYKSDDMYTFANVGNDAAVSKDGTVMSSCVAGLMLSEDNLYFDCERAIYAAMANVCAEGGVPVTMNVDVIIPEKRLESELKELTRYIAKIALEANIHITGGNTEVTRAVKSPVVTFTVLGHYIYDTYIDACEWVKEDYDIVLTKQIGMSGTVALAKEKYNELKEKFQVSYLKKALDMEKYLDVRSEAAVAGSLGVRVMHDLSRGGIYLGLWQLAAKTQKGVEVMMDDIDIRQETIEICEPYGINPYKLMSNGAMLMVTEDGETLVRELRHQGTDARIIGRLTNDNDKVILKNEDRRYIEPPKRDELEIFLTK